MVPLVSRGHVDTTPVMSTGKAHQALAPRAHLCVGGGYFCAFLISLSATAASRSMPV